MNTGRMRAAVLLTTGASVLYVCLVVFFGGWMLKVSVKSLSVGGWGMGQHPVVVEVDEEIKAIISKELPDGVDPDLILLPGKGDFLYNSVIGRRYREDAQGQIHFQQGLEFAIEHYRAANGRLPEKLEDLLIAPESGAPYLCHPQNGRSQMLEGSKQPAILAQAMEMDEVLGHERIVALMCPEPFAYSDIEAPIRGLGPMHNTQDRLPALRQGCAQREIILQKTLP